MANKVQRQIVWPPAQAERPLTLSSLHAYSILFCLFSPNLAYEGLDELFGLQGPGDRVAYFWGPWK